MKLFHDLVERGPNLNTEATEAMRDNLSPTYLHHLWRLIGRQVRIMGATVRRWQFCTTATCVQYLPLEEFVNKNSKQAVEVDALLVRDTVIFNEKPGVTFGESFWTVITDLDIRPAEAVVQTLKVRLKEYSEMAVKCRKTGNQQGASAAKKLEVKCRRQGSSSKQCRAVIDGGGSALKWLLGVATQADLAAFESVEASLQWLRDLAGALDEVLALLANGRLAPQIFQPAQMASVLKEVNRQLPLGWAVSSEELWVTYREAMVTVAKVEGRFRIFIKITIYDHAQQHTLFEISSLPRATDNGTQGKMGLGIWGAGKSCAISLFTNDANRKLTQCRQQFKKWKGSEVNYLGENLWAFSAITAHDAVFSCPIARTEDSASLDGRSEASLDPLVAPTLWTTRRHLESATRGDSYSNYLLLFEVTIESQKDMLLNIQDTIQLPKTNPHMQLSVCLKEVSFPTYLQLPLCLKEDYSTAQNTLPVPIPKTIRLAALDDLVEQLKNLYEQDSYVKKRVAEEEKICQRCLDVAVDIYTTGIHETFFRIAAQCNGSMLYRKMLKHVLTLVEQHKTGYPRLFTSVTSHGDSKIQFAELVKLELINEEGEKVRRQMRVITTGGELRKAKFMFDKEDINANSKKPGGIYSSCHVNMERSLPTDFNCSSFLSEELKGLIDQIQHK
ncbi:hypothetical protein DAPPUDRAFT_328712 [Daphnia pulex]|uniref:Uncharacterized protein n=1 Tax=Daphnia pulex TaxID=6669 RepID=E9HEJ2_DAPPU|nr:hypothetical protein DAPPUDRAFT_328712 [Daphnia pulex]|eukprot:EFX69869.1 hypothetical protein DAPPUDRAFT_328712 [Daphnia pulex]